MKTLKTILLGVGILASTLSYGQAPAADDTLSNGFLDYDQSVYDWVDDSADYAGDIIYVDGTTITWGNLVQEDDVAYLMQKGTTYGSDVTITSRGNLIGSYGIGVTPELGKMTLEGNGTTVRDLKFTDEYWVGAFNDPVDSTIIFNCEYLEQVWSGGGDLGFYGSLIHGAQIDGIFARNTSSSHHDLEIAHTRIVRINLRWFIDPSPIPSGSPGDNIQVQSYDAHIHHNILDHSYTGNKFNLIIGDYATSPSSGPYTGLVEYNTMVLPKQTTNDGSGIYVADEMNIDIRNNILYTTDVLKKGYAIYLDGVSLTAYIYGNVAYGMQYDFKNNGTNYIFNNTTDDLTSSEAYSWSNYATNNIIPSDPGGMDASNMFIDEENTATLFVDYASKNYRLLDGSAAINFGTNDATTARYTYDLDSTVVPVSNIDVGAFQYAFTPPPPSGNWPDSVFSYWNFSNNVNDSIGTNDGVIIGSLSYTDNRAGLANSALSWGTGDVTLASTIDFTASQGWTASWWMKPNSTFRNILYHSSSNEVIYSDEKIRFDNTGTHFDFATTAPLDEWHMYSLVAKKDNYLVLYIDTVAVDSSLLATNAFSVSKIGSTPSFSGVMDDVLFSNDTMNSDEIYARYYNFPYVDPCDTTTIVVTGVVDSITCYGGNDGAVTTSTIGGTGVYTYLWSNSETTQNISDLEPGGFTVTATDENGCYGGNSFTVYEPNELIAAIIINNTISCYGEKDGSVTIAPSGGTYPYTYLWSNGVTTNRVDTLRGDVEYTVVVTDDNLCDTTVAFTVSSPDSLVVDDDLFYIMPDTNGTSVGSINAPATGGTSPYNYSWSSGETAALIEDKMFGVYTLTITDANLCDTVIEYTIPNISDPCFEVVISINDSIAPASGAATADGGAYLFPTGGSGFYGYSWSSGENTSFIDNKLFGTYYVTVYDVNDCSVDDSVYISVSSGAPLDTISYNVDTKSSQWAIKINAGIYQANNRIPTSMDTILTGTDGPGDWYYKTNVFIKKFPSIATDTAIYLQDNWTTFKIKANAAIREEDNTD